MHAEDRSFIKFFDTLEELHDFVALQVWFAFGTMNCREDFPQWRDDAIQNALMRLYARKEYLNTNAKLKKIVGEEVRCLTYEFVVKQIFGDGNHYKTYGEKISFINVNWQDTRIQIEAQDGYALRFQPVDLEILFPDSAPDVRAKWASLLHMRLEGYPYQAIADRTGIDYHVVRATCSRIRKKLEKLAKKDKQ